MAALSSIAYPLWGIFNTWMIVACLCMGVSFLIWQYLLGKKPISFLHPFCSLVYAVIPIFSFIIFDERVSVQYMIGIFCILLGVVFTTRGVVGESTTEQAQGKNNAYGN
ncbi:MAG: EamA family transporter [Deltaproteobacteria bacterium]|jgi:drug/metabolite transporter (DMT)-like permease|nr:EamA family transporter [Deltaproteobacteria bacterium]